MGISEKFENFCAALRMSSSTVSNISDRAKQITQRINRDFRAISSDTKFSLFVGSYGRGTDIHTSDIDMIIELPYSSYQRYNGYNFNGQSSLIQAVRDSIKTTYSKTHLRGDGQVVKLNFTDGICFEIVPGFINKDNKSFTYPDTSSGGSWKITNPRAEIEEFNRANIEWNKNLKRLCRMARAWKMLWNVPISGLLIDTLAYNFLKNWEFNSHGFILYDWLIRDFFEYLKNQDSNKQYWFAPGSNQKVYRKGSFEYKALQCYNLSLEAINYEVKKMPYTANDYWKRIYGNKF